MASLKYSRQRETIRQHLRQRMDHPTAEMIYTALKPEDPKLSLGTVYRNLALLTELGEVRKIQTETGPDRYDGNLKEHFHFLCSCCHGIFDLYPDQPQILTELVQGWQSGTVERISLHAYGLCPGCSQKQDASLDADSCNRKQK